MSGIRDNFDEELRLNHAFLETGLESFLRDLLIFANTRIIAVSNSKYMQDAGFGAGPRPPGMSGPIRIVTGRLFRGVAQRFSARAGGSREGRVSIKIGGGGRLARLIKEVFTPYAGVHEDGFEGTVTVPEHYRTITQAFGRPIASRRVRVRRHDRRMSIKARPYLGPALEDVLPEVEIEGGKRIARLLLQPAT